MAWSREIIGWLLVALGIAAFGMGFVFLTNRRIFEAAPMAFMGFIIFRGGVHLVKVAVAARLCQTASDTLTARPITIAPRVSATARRVAAKPAPRQIVSQD